jgi:hypothetical protein
MTVDPKSTVAELRKQCEAEGIDSSKALKAALIARLNDHYSASAAGNGVVEKEDVDMFGDDKSGTLGQQEEEEERRDRRRRRHTSSACCPLASVRWVLHSCPFVPLCFHFIHGCTAHDH